MLVVAFRNADKIEALQCSHLSSKLWYVLHQCIEVLLMSNIIIAVDPKPSVITV